MKIKNLYLWLILLGSGVYITGLFPDVGIDAGKYAAISRYVYESGDFMHLKIHNEPYMQKPVLFFWLSALSFSLFGLSMFAFKLPSLLFTLLGIYSTYRLAKLFYGKSTALLAGIIYASSQMLFLYTNDLHTDALLTANMIFGIWQMAEYLQHGKLSHLIAGFAGTGLAMITKGPIGLAVPVIAIGGHLLMKKQWSNILSPAWLIGIPILAIILFPTLKGNYDQFGTDGIRFFFITNNIGRITGKYSGTSTDYFFYLHTIVYIFLPWSLYAFTAFFFNIRNLSHKNIRHRQRPEYMSYSAIILYALILSVSRQKAPHYLFPLIPFFSIIVADLTNKVCRIRSLLKLYKIMKGFRNGIIVFVWILIATILLYIFPDAKWTIWIPLLAVSALLIYSLVKIATRKENLIIPLVITSIALNFVLNAHFIPRAFTYQGVISASYRYNELASGDEALYTYIYNGFETYYYPKKISVRIFNPEQLDSALNNQNVWFITTKDGFNEISEKAGNRISFFEEFHFRKISELDFHFLNPATREKTLQKIYLVKVI